jgi:hypothetical protein
LKSLLTLARCSGFTLSAHLVWEYVPLKFECGVERQSLSNFAAQWSSSLVRFGSLQLHWHAALQLDEPPVQADFIRVAALRLRTLTIYGFECIKAQHVRWLTQGLQQADNTSFFEELNLSSHGLGDEGAKAIAEMLPLCPRLKSLNLPGCKINDAGCESLARALETHPSVVQVNLSYNGGIGTRGLKALLPAIQHRLEQVWLQNCRLSDADFSLLLNTLMQNDRMKLCDCSFNTAVHPERHESSIAALQRKRPDFNTQGLKQMH